MDAYLNNSDVEKMYEKVNLGSRKGITRFMKLARNLASKRGNVVEYRDEEALFDLFKREMPEQLAKRRITRFYEIVQLIS